MAVCVYFLNKTIKCLAIRLSRSTPIYNPNPPILQAIQIRKSFLSLFIFHILLCINSNRLFSLLIIVTNKRKLFKTVQKTGNTSGNVNRYSNRYDYSGPLSSSFFAPSSPSFFSSSTFSVSSYFCSIFSANAPPVIFSATTSDTTDKSSLQSSLDLNASDTTLAIHPLGLTNLSLSFSFGCNCFCFDFSLHLLPCLRFGLEFRHCFLRIA